VRSAAPSLYCFPCAGTGRCLIAGCQGSGRGSLAPCGGRVTETLSASVGPVDRVHIAFKYLVVKNVDGPKYLVVKKCRRPNGESPPLTPTVTRHDAPQRQPAPQRALGAPHSPPEGPGPRASLARPRAARWGALQGRASFCWQPRFPQDILALAGTLPHRRPPGSQTSYDAPHASLLGRPGARRPGAAGPGGADRLADRGRGGLGAALGRRPGVRRWPAGTRQAPPPVGCGRISACFTGPRPQILFCLRAPEPKNLRPSSLPARNVRLSGPAAAACRHADTYSSMLHALDRTSCGLQGTLPNPGAEIGGLRLASPNEMQEAA
jgi:hypothetical protein